jgi:hypothetical protein
MADDATLSPQQAAQALTDLGRYEEGLSARVGALTGMVWGIVSAAIFVAYGALGSDGAGLPMWVMPWLWLPWTAAGIILTNAMWKLHAITLRRPAGHGRRRSWAWSLGFAALFAVALLGLHLLRLHAGAFPYMLVVNGLVSFILVAILSRQRGRFTGVPLLVSGLLICAGAVAIGMADLQPVAMGFLSAALVGTCWVGAGLWGFVRG